MHPKVLLRFDGIIETPFELFQLFRRLLRPKLVVNDFQRACLLDSSVRSRAVRAVDNFPSHDVDSFTQALSLEVLKIRPAKPLEVGTAVLLIEKYTGACLATKNEHELRKRKKPRVHFADALKNSDGMFEVTDMKHWDAELDIRVVPNTIHRRESTGLAKRALL